MSWRAHVTDSFAAIGVEVRIVDAYDDHADVVTVEDGRTIATRVGRGEQMPPALTLPYEAVEALRDALNGHAPPPSDADLREALQVERGRVDRILGTLTADQEPRP